MKKFVVLSGKGGVGKTSIASSIAVELSKKHKIVAVDCDVDASNLPLSLGLTKFEKKEKISTGVRAKIVSSKCVNCGICAENCPFNAISLKNGKYFITPYLCEGCKVCSLVCPKAAIELYEVKNAEVGYGKTKFGFNVFFAQLFAGETGSGKVVDYVKSLAEKSSFNTEIIVMDGAAGIGCPVIASIRDADYALLITEPSPTAFSDLKRLLKLLDFFKIPRALIINKYTLDENFTEKIEKFAEKNKIKIVGKIPYDRQFVTAAVNLTPPTIYIPKYSHLFENISRFLEGKL